MGTSNPDELGFSFTPPVPGVINPDLAINAALAPVVPVVDDTPRPLGRGWSFDFIANEFVANGLSPAQVYDVDHLRVWIEKVLRTARYAHPVHGNTYGVEDPFDLIGQPYTGELMGSYIERIRDALTVHDRIRAVQDFLFQQDPGTGDVYVSFTVVLDDTNQSTVTVDAVPVAGATS